jgi:hypothetical protein
MRYAAALLLLVLLAALPARAQAPGPHPTIVGNAEKGGVMRNLPTGASEAEIETWAADYTF